MSLWISTGPCVKIHLFCGPCARSSNPDPRWEKAKENSMKLLCCIDC